MQLVNKYLLFIYCLNKSNYLFSFFIYYIFNILFSLLWHVFKLDIKKIKVEDSRNTSPFIISVLFRKLICITTIFEHIFLYLFFRVSYDLKKNDYYFLKSINLRVLPQFSRNVFHKFIHMTLIPLAFYTKQEAEEAWNSQLLRKTWRAPVI